MTGWIKLHRELFKKAIWITSTPEQKTILITLLSMANYEANQWEWGCKKFTVNPGEFITSTRSIVKECGKGINRQHVRTALVRFEKLEFLTHESTSHGTKITITNWERYQSTDDTSNPLSNPRVTHGSPTGNPRVTTIKEVKEVKNERSTSLRAKKTQKPKKPHPGKPHLKELQELSDHHADLWDREHVPVALNDHVRRIVKVLERLGMEKCKLVQEGHRATTRDDRYSAWQFAYPMVRDGGRRRVTEPDWEWIENHRAAGERATTWQV